MDATEPADPAMTAPLRTVEVPRNSGAAIVLRRGERLRVHARSIVDVVALDLDNPRHRFDQARTKSNLAKIWPTTGDVLFSKANQPMLRITEDTFPESRHDLQKGMCSRVRFEMVARGESRRIFAEGLDPNPTPETILDHGCWENLIAALEPWSIPGEDIPSPINLFQTMRIDPQTGEMFDTLLQPPEGTYVELEALMNLIIGVSACPQSGRGREVRLEIHPGPHAEPG